MWLAMPTVVLPCIKISHPFSSDTPWYLPQVEHLIVEHLSSIRLLDKPPRLSYHTCTSITVQLNKAYFHHADNFFAMFPNVENLRLDLTLQGLQVSFPSVCIPKLKRLLLSGPFVSPEKLFCWLENFQLPNLEEIFFASANSAMQENLREVCS